jgi:hypothetical protein
MKEYKFCQSCGYPLKKDKKGGGDRKRRFHKQEVLLHVL